MFKKIFLLIIIVGVLFYFFGREEPQKPPQEKLTEAFSQKMVQFGIQKVGDPIEGFDAQALKDSFVGLTDKDFDGVETLEGAYAYATASLEYIRAKTGEAVTSAEQTISEQGYGQLLDNITMRLGLTIENVQDIDTVLEALSTSSSPTMAPEAVYPSKVVYGTSPEQVDVTAAQLDCQGRGGIFNTCGSACGPAAEACIAVCAFTCEALSDF